MLIPLSPFATSTLKQFTTQWASSTACTAFWKDTYVNTLLNLVSTAWSSNRLEQNILVAHCPSCCFKCICVKMLTKAWRKASMRVDMFVQIHNGQLHQVSLYAEKKNWDLVAAFERDEVSPSNFYWTYYPFLVPRTKQPFSKANSVTLCGVWWVELTCRLNSIWVKNGKTWVVASNTQAGEVMNAWRYKPISWALLQRIENISELIQNLVTHCNVTLVVHVTCWHRVDA